MTFSTLGTMASYVPKVGVTGTVDLSTAVVKGAGMDLITPTSVAGTGVTLSGGQVSFSAATSISINGVFTALYQNYMLIVTGLASASNIWTHMRMRSSGTDATGSNYTDQLLDVAGTSVGAAQRSSATDGLRIVYADGANNFAAQTTIFRPFDTAVTSTLSSSLGGSSSVAYRPTSGQHGLATSYDGCTLLALTGNITGTVRIYGLRNS